MGREHPQETLAELKNDYLPKPNPGLAITFDEGESGSAEFASNSQSSDGPSTRRINHDSGADAAVALKRRRSGPRSNTADGERTL